MGLASRPLLEPQDARVVAIVHLVQSPRPPQHPSRRFHLNAEKGAEGGGADRGEGSTAAAVPVRIEKTGAAAGAAVAQQRGTHQQAGGAVPGSK